MYMARRNKQKKNQLNQTNWLITFRTCLPTIFLFKANSLMTTELPRKCEPTLTSAKCCHKIDAGYAVLMICWVLIYFEGRIEHFTQQVCSLLSPTFLFAQCEKILLYCIFFFQNHLQKQCAFEFLLLIYFILFALSMIWIDNIFSTTLCFHVSGCL